MSSQFHPYLESIRATYEKWWQLYTLTDAAGKERQAKQAAPTFDFGLIVQTAKKEERCEEEKIERFPVLEGIRKYAEQHVLLVGRPGSGKSTALARLMLEEATIASSRLPVLVELRYWQGSIEQLIRDSFDRHDLPAELFEEALKRSLILFDGVNELPSEEARSQLSAFRRNHPKLPMIFTTRDLSIGGDLGIERKLEMQPLTEAQMQTFIRAYVPEQAEAMLRQLKDRLREFGQTPLLLWMLCGVFQQTGTIPENLGLVFREFTQGYERYLKDDVRIESDRAWWKPVLQQLAWVMMQGEKPTEFRVAIRREEAVRAIAQFLDGKVPYAEDFARKCLRDLQRHHLIQAGTNPEELEFRHQLIQEYYAAEALLKKLPHLNDEQLKREFLNFLKWTESISLMLALANEVQAVLVVTLALEVDLVLGARLGGEVKLEFQEKTVKVVDKQKVPTWLKAELLKTTDTEYAVLLLAAQLQSSVDPENRSFAAQALGEMNLKDIETILIPSLQDTNKNVRVSVAYSLGIVGTKQALPALLNLLQDEAVIVLEAVIDVLEEISSRCGVAGLQKAVDSVPESEKRLLEVLKNHYFDAINSESACVKILGYEPPDIEFEENYYDDDCWSDNSYDVEADLDRFLGREENDVEEDGFEEEYLEDDFEEEDSEKNCGKVRDYETYWSELLSNHSKELVIRQNKINELKNISSTEAVSQLIEALGDEDYSVRYCAADMLCILASDTVITNLLKLIENHELGLNREAKQVLKSIAKKHTNTIAHYLPHFLTLIPTIAGEDAFEVVLAIQENCKYYNYEIYQDYLKAQKADRQTPQNNDRSQTAIANAITVQTVERLTLMTDKAPIFNQQNPTIGVNYAAEGSNIEFTQQISSSEQNFEILLTNYQSFINELQQKYPNLADANAASQIIEVEAKLIEAKDQHRWQNFLNLKRLWNGGKKAGIKVGEHFAENNVWAKGAIAFLEGVSEDVK